jgi:hypothetical protein
MTYFFSSGNKIVGVSLISGLITSSVPKSYESDAIAFDMMRSTQNCFNAKALRFINSPIVEEETPNAKIEAILFPNPAKNQITLKINSSINNIEILDSRGRLVLVSKQKTIDISSLSSGIYFLKAVTESGSLFTDKFVKY